MLWAVREVGINTTGTLIKSQLKQFTSKKFALELFSIPSQLSHVIVT